jgi:hypothetical protein
MTLEERYIDSVIEIIPGDRLRSQIAIRPASHRRRRAERSNRSTRFSANSVIETRGVLPPAVPLERTVFGTGQAQFIDVLILIVIIVALAWASCASAIRFHGDPWRCWSAFTGTDDGGMADRTTYRRRLRHSRIKESGATWLWPGDCSPTPLLLRVCWIGVLFTLFTEKKQRAFAAVQDSCRSRQRLREVWATTVVGRRHT